MRYAAKRDANETAIIAFLRRCGASVTQIDSRGIPDLLVGYRGVNLLLEVKSETGTLTEDQVAFFAGWRGQKAIVRSIKDTKKELRAIMGIALGTRVKLIKDFSYYSDQIGNGYKCHTLQKQTEGVVVGYYPNKFAPSIFLEIQFDNKRVGVPKKLLEEI